MRFAYLLIPVFLFTTQFLFSQQDTTETVKLTLKDNSQLIGTILSEDSTSVYFETSGGILITIPRTQIEKIESYSTVTYDQNDVRLLFSPTAIPLKPGHGYVSVYQIFFPFAAFGVTSFFTFGGGISLIPGAKEQFLYLVPKLTPVKLGNLSLAAGAIYIGISTKETIRFGLFYGMATYTGKKASVSAGLGLVFANWNSLTLQSNLIPIVGGIFRISRNLGFITENWFIPGNPVISFGIRFSSKKVAGDLAFVHFSNGIETGFPFLPWVGFAYNF